MASAEESVQPSFFPDITPDLKLIPDQPEAEQPSILSELRRIGISLSPFDPQYSRIIAPEGSILTLSKTPGAFRARRPPRASWPASEQWHFLEAPDGPFLRQISGYIVSCAMLNLDGQIEVGLRSTPFIADDGTFDTLFIAKDIESIETVAPKVTSRMIELERTILDSDTYAEEKDQLANLIDHAPLKRIWTRGAGVSSDENIS